jgi:sugar lactone lactonase YvrE
MIHNKQRNSFFSAVTSFLILLLFVGIQAGQPLVWETSSRAELLKGDARGVSISDTGVLRLAPKLTEVFNTQQTYIWSSAISNQGDVFLGTGHDGRIYRVAADGSGSLLYDAAELDVTALAVGKDDVLYAGTSPDGKVYRITPDGHAEVYFDPGDKYIWSLAILQDGSLAVGTGDNGKLYRVRSAGTKPESALFVSTTQTHVISLAVTAQGDLIAGTDSGGLVLRISPNGKTFALFDTQLREIHALAPAPDGSIYALALSDAAATARPPSTPAAAPQPGEATGSGTSVTITPLDETGAPLQSASAPARSRTDVSNARSAVFRILPDGAADVVWSSTNVTAFSIAPGLQPGSVLIGTAEKGRVYSVTNDGRDTLLLQSSEGQISSLSVKNDQVYAASSNQGKLFRFGGELVSEGSYESPVRDAKLTASWGRVWWRGAGSVDLQTRSGNGERPDATWSEWSASYKNPEGNQITSPRARFIQWRATLRSSVVASPQTWMEDVSVAYLPRNVAPEIFSITALPVGVGLQQVAQVIVDPNVESSGLDPSMFGPIAQVPPRRFYQRGARSFQWQAEDRNGDTLEYAIYYRSLNESTFRLLKDKLRDNFYTIDGATLADGRYVIKVVASDAPDNPPGQKLMGERLSEPVDIDNTPPVVRVLGQPQVGTDGLRVVFAVDDATGKIRRSDASIDGSPWSPVFPDDGIADSGHEIYSLDFAVLAAGEHTISLRSFDASGNVGTLSVTIRR